ncbi:MAG: hypothetical protein ACHQ50_15340 [Fimbriimonadales bacterium]
MGSNTFIRSASLLAVLAAAISIGIGQAGRARGHQGRAGGPQLQSPPVFEPLTAKAKAEILKAIHVTKDPTSVLRSYDVLHPIDEAGGCLSLRGASEVDFCNGVARLDMATGAVTVFFKPIAANKLHLILFTIATYTRGNIVAVAEDNSGAHQTSQTVSVRAGTAYVPVKYKPTTSQWVDVKISAPNMGFALSNVTVELVN